MKALILAVALTLTGCATTGEQPPSADSCTTTLCKGVKGLTAALVFAPLLITAPGEAGNASALVSDLINVGTNAEIVKRAYDEPPYDTHPQYYDDGEHR